MARHRRRHHRRSHRRGLKGFLDPVYTGNVSAMQVLVGAAVGTVGAAVVKLGLNKITMKNKDGVELGLLQPGGALDFVAPVVPLITASLAGAGLFLVQKKSDMGRAHLVGSVAAGASLSVMDYLKTVKDSKGNLMFSDYVSFPAVAGYNDYVRFPTMGVIANNPRLQGYGVIANNPRLAEVTASAMGGMGDYDMMDAFTA